MSKHTYQFETLQLHAGQEKPDPVTDARAVPIYQTTSYVFHNCEHAADRFALRDAGNIYGRLTNPTESVFEERICALEGGAAALATASGAAAITYAFQNLAQAGDHIVAAKTIYGGTYNLLAHTLPEFGISATFVDPDRGDWADAIQENTKAIFIESIGNPNANLIDIEKVAEIAHSHKIPLIVDNTFATPVNCRPFEWGADIVTHSTTKYMDGHANAVGGAIVDSGRFDWTAHADKFPGLTTPDESYHGVTYAERFGLEGAYITKATAQLMRDFGAIPAPMNAYLLNVGLETLPLRMARHCENALAVARFLKGHPKVSWVRYPGLGGDPYYERAQKYLPNGTCGVVSFGVKGGREAASRLMAGLELASIATHVADAKTCVLHPASTTHRQMSDAELAAAGVAPDLVRFSVGIEDVDDILADLEKALEGA